MDADDVNEYKVWTMIEVISVVLSVSTHILHIPQCHLEHLTRAPLFL